MACRWAVALTIICGTEVGAALDHLSADADVRLGRIETVLQPATARIADRAAGPLAFSGQGKAGGGPPITRPFPRIADHVVKPVAVGRKAAHRRSPLKA